MTFHFDIQAAGETEQHLGVRMGVRAMIPSVSPQLGAS